MQIINLTQHPATPEQRAAGVVDLSPEGRETISRLLTFADIPEGAEVRVRAGMLAQIAAGDSRSVLEVSPGDYRAAMIGGAPFLMRPLEDALRTRGITPMYAFSRRVSEEEQQPDGSVRKNGVFRHAGFVVCEEE